MLVPPRLFAEWDAGAWITTEQHDFRSDFAALVERYGPPDRVEFRAQDEGITSFELEVES